VREQAGAQGHRPSEGRTSCVRLVFLSVHMCRLRSACLHSLVARPRGSHSWPFRGCGSTRWHVCALRAARRPPATACGIRCCTTTAGDPTFQKKTSARASFETRTLMRRARPSVACASCLPVRATVRDQSDVPPGAAGYPHRLPRRLTLAVDEKTPHYGCMPQPCAMCSVGPFLSYC